MAKEEVQVWRPAELAAAVKQSPGADSISLRAVPGFGSPGPEPAAAWPEAGEPARESSDVLLDTPEEQSSDQLPNGSEAKLADAEGFTCCHCWGVPQKEVQRWCDEVANEMQMVADAVDAKYELWRAKMAEKDQVIKRLFVKLKDLMESTAQTQNVYGSSSQPAASVGMRSPMRAANRVARGAPGSPSGASRALLAAQSVEGLQALFSGARLGRAGSLSPSTRIDSINGRGSPPEDRAGPGPRPRRVTAEAEKLGPAAAALQSPTAAAMRKTQRPREAAERVQILYLRQEIAQLRRQNAELQGQVRAGDAQVDQLSTVVKELQEVQRSRVSWKDSLPSAATVTPLGAPPGSGSGASTPSTATPCVAAAPVPLATACSSGAAEPRRPDVVLVQRRMSMEGQPASGVIVASSRVSAAATQAQRASRRAAAEAAGSGERGSSVSRPNSAFQRHKDQLGASRRVIVAPQATGPPPLGQMSRMFSPRSRQWQSSRSIGSCASLREPAAAAASIAQAAQAVALAGQDSSQPQVRSGATSGTVVGGASAGGSSTSASAFRSASVDNRNRTRISTARRSLRRH